MTRSRRHGLIRRFAPALPIVMLLGACGLASLVLSSCRRAEVSTAVPSRPIKFEGVPTIRVRITPRPVDFAEVSTTNGYCILADGREVDRSPTQLVKTTCRRADGRWLIGPLDIEARTLSIIPQPDGLVRFGKRTYRGRLVMLPEGRGRFFVQNHLDMESYLASVLAKELYSHFHPETYRAQAVAARTFALSEMLTRGRKSPFDVWDSQRSQVYAGMLAETDRSWSAVRDTHAWVLAYGPAGREQIFLTQFSACNGGYVNGAHVIRELRKGEKIPPLAGGQKDGDGGKCPYYTWPTVRVAKPDIYRALARRYKKIRELGGIKTLRVKTAAPYGRAIWLEVLGPGNTKNIVPVRAEDVRLCLLRENIPAAKKLYSMNCGIRDLGDSIEFHDGRGFGHGVGLSQWGAEQKARRGMKAEKILDFYYPGSAVFKAY